MKLSSTIERPWQRTKTLKPLSSNRCSMGHFSRPGRAIVPVCVCVTVYGLCTTIFARNDLWPKYLASCLILTWSYLCQVGDGSKFTATLEKCFKAVSATSSEGLVSSYFVNGPSFAWLFFPTSFSFVAWCMLLFSASKSILQQHVDDL